MDGDTMFGAASGTGSHVGLPLRDWVRRFSACALSAGRSSFGGCGRPFLIPVPRFP
jgi:hypothetical protein